MREGTCFLLVPLLNGMKLFILSGKVAVEKGWHVLASSSRRGSMSLTGIVRLAEKLRVCHPSAQEKNRCIERGHM